MSKIADRSVSISLRARVSGFITGIQQAKKSTQDLSRQMTETGAYADNFRRRLEAATKALPKIEIDADSSPAEIKFAELRRQMETLADKKIGIDIDAASAQAEIQQIERELENLQRNEASIEVRADIGTALAELRAVQGEVGRVNGQTANVRVDADVSGALRNIALVGAALASLPAAVTIGAGVAGLGAAFGAAAAGAGAFSAVAIPAFGRVNDAVKEMGKNTGSAGGATKSAGQAAATAAQQALQLEQAERRVSDAKKAAKLAEEDLTRARKDARRAIEDLNLSLKDGILSERDAALAVEEAQQRLNETLADPKATELQRQRAQLDYEQAVQRLEDQRVRTKRLHEDTAKANKAGVEGSDQVRQAKEKESKADQAVIDAQKQLQVLLLQQKAALEQAGGAAGGAASKFGELSKREQQMARDLKGFQDGYIAWQRSLEGDVFPAIKGGLDLVTEGLPKISPLVKSASGAFVGLEKDAKKALRGPFWDEFLKDVNKEIPGAITGLGHTAGNILTGMAGAFDAVLPHSGSVVDALEKGSERFAKWGQELKDSPDFHEFVNFVKTQAPEIAHLIGDVAVSAGHIVQALAPFGVGTLGGLQLLAKITAGMSVGQIQGVAIAVAAIYTAVKVGGAVNAGLGALETLNKRMSTAGETAKSAKGKLSSFAGVLSAGGPWGIAVGAGITALGLFAGAQAEAKKKVDDLAGALDKSTGAITKQARETVKQTLIDDGTLERAKKLGLNLQDVTDAALGNEAAIKRVNQALLEFSGQGDSLHPKVAALGDATKTLSGDALLLQQRLISSNGTLAEARNQLSLTAEADGKVLAAQNLLNTAYGNATTALAVANGKLDINAQMTDKQKEAVKRAQEAFGGLLEAVGKNAKATYDLTGKTGDATAAVAAQLPKLFDLAGSSETAKNRIYELAKAYGISKQDADKASKGGKDLKDVLDKLKSKDIRINMDTSAAEAKLKKLYEWQLKILNINSKIPEGIAAPKAKKSADGNVFAPFAEGGITQVAGGAVHRLGDVRSYAAGGVDRRALSKMSSFAAGSERHVAQIAPAGAMRIWAEPETGGEAYIPLAGAKRARSTEILGAVASAFGYALIPAGRVFMAASSAVPAAGAVMAGSASRSLPVSGTGSGGTGSASARRSAPQMGNPNYYSGVYSQAAQSGSLPGRLAHEGAGAGAGAKSSDRPTINIEKYYEAEGGSARKTAEEMNFIGRRS